MILTKNKAEFRNLDDSAVISSDFPDLRTFGASKTSTASTTSVASMILQLISSNKLLVLKVGTSLAPKWPIMVSFCWMDHQKSNFSLISDTLPVRGCWGQPMLLFWKVIDETQMGNPRDHAVRDISSKFSIFLPLRAILKKPYHYETPCRYMQIKLRDMTRKKNVGK